MAPPPVYCRQKHEYVVGKVWRMSASESSRAVLVMEPEGEVRPRVSAKRRPRPCSASYLAVRAALYQLTRLSDFRAEKIGGGFYADVFKVSFEGCVVSVVLCCTIRRNELKYSGFSFRSSDGSYWCTQKDVWIMVVLFWGRLK